MSIQELSGINNPDYRAEATELMMLYKKKCDEAIDKYPDYKGSGGLDGEPYGLEIKQLQIWVTKELNKIKTKYGIPLLNRKSNENH